MAKLGEAYVRVRADLEPFGKDLDRGLKTLTDKFEKSLNRKFGKAIGTDMGSGVRDGLRESSKGLGDEIDKGLRVRGGGSRSRGRRAGKDFGDGYGEGLAGTIKRISGLFITAIEDGFSSLPPQVKGVIGAALITAIVPAGAFLTAAIGSAVIAGTAGVGIALATQFQEVEDRWGVFLDRIRTQAVRAAEPFAGEIVATLDFFEDELKRLDPQLRTLFANAAKYVEPFARGTAAAIDGIISGINDGIAAAQFADLAAAFELGIGNLGAQLGDALYEILSNPNLDDALFDLLIVLGDLVEFSGDFLSFTLDAYQALRDIGSAAAWVVDTLYDFLRVLDGITSTDPGDWSDRVSERWNDLTRQFTTGGEEIVMVAGKINKANRVWRDSTGATIKITEEQEKALKELNKEIEANLRLTNDVISTQISYQDAIAQTTADIKENGRSLNLKDEIGRRNAKNIQNEINALREQVKAQIESGEITNEQGQKFYDQEIARIRGRFNGNKTLLAQFDELFGKLAALQAVPPVPDKFGPFRAALGPIIAALGAIAEKQRQIREQGLPSTNNKSGVGPGQQKYADGGFITEPTNAIMGENYKEEVVLPLTNTRRSMQLLSQSPLAGMLGGSTNVAVYIGNEQLASRQYKVAQGVSRQNARTLSQTPRMV